MIDNRELIKDYMSFDPEDTDSFYFIQIIKRKKENPDMKRSSRVVRVFCATSKEKLDELFPIIQQLCVNENARAYIHLNKRSFSRVTMYMIKYLVDMLQSGQTNASQNAFSVACGKTHAESEKTWLVDVDTKDWSIVDQLTTIINHCEPEGDKIKAIVPTLHGFHLISKPFNMKTFRLAYPEEIDIHKDNPTVLFAPDVQVQGD